MFNSEELTTHNDDLYQKQLHLQENFATRLADPQEVVKPKALMARLRNVEKLQVSVDTFYPSANQLSRKEAMLLSLANS